MYVYPRHHQTGIRQKLSGALQEHSDTFSRTFPENVYDDVYTWYSVI